MKPRNFLKSVVFPNTPYFPHKCEQCGDVLTDSEHMRRHAVEKHGAVRDGNVVFIRRKCHCGKPALYHVGGLNVCRDHREEAVSKRVEIDQKVFRKKQEFFNQRDVRYE